MSVESCQRTSLPASFVAFLCCGCAIAILVQLPLSIAGVPLVRVGALALLLACAALALARFLGIWLDARILLAGAGILSVALSLLILLLRPPLAATYVAADKDLGGVSGLFEPETDPTGATFRWTGPRATFLFHSGARQPVALRIAARSAALAGGADTPVRVYANGNEIGTIRPDLHMATFQPFTLPVTLGDTWGGAISPPSRIATLPPDRLRVVVDLIAQPFTPGRGDTRELGTMVQTVTLDQQAAWTHFAGQRRALLAVLAAALTGLGAFALHTRFPRSAVGVVAILAGLAQMIAACCVLRALLALGPISAPFYWGSLVGLLGIVVCGGALAIVYGAQLIGAVRPVQWRFPEHVGHIRQRWNHSPLRTAWDRLGAWCGQHQAALIGGGVAVAAGLVFYLPARWAGDLPVHPDSTEYATAAVNMLRGKGFVFIDHGVAYPPRYPIGFPALLVPFYWLLGPYPGNGLWAVTLSAVGAAAMAYLIARRFVRPPAAAIAGAVFLCSPIYLHWSQQVMSDFTSVLLATALAMALFVIARRGTFHWGYALLFGFVASLMMLTRIVDALIVLVALGLLVVAAWRSRVSVWYAVSGALFFLLTIGATLVYNHARFGGWATSGYAYWDPRYYRRLHDTFAWTYAVSAKYLQPKQINGPNALAYARALAGFGALFSTPVILLALFGATRLVARRGTLSTPQRTVALFLGASALVYLGTYTFYYFQSERFLITLLPAIGVAAAYGVQTIFSRAADRPSRLRSGRAFPWAPAIAGVLLALMGVFAFHGVVTQSYLYLEKVEDYHPPYRRSYDVNAAIAPLCAPRCIIVGGPAAYVEFVVPTAFAIEPDGPTYAATLRGPTANAMTTDAQLRMIADALRTDVPVFYDDALPKGAVHFYTAMAALGQPRLVRDAGYYAIYQLVPRA
jgi:4-amino-4-deoxy-L-arabinose transferase-like glycosyltransferase